MVSPEFEPRIIFRAEVGPKPQTSEELQWVILNCTTIGTAPSGTFPQLIVEQAEWRLRNAQRRLIERQQRVI